MKIFTEDLHVSHITSYKMVIIFLFMKFVNYWLIELNYNEKGSWLIRFSYDA